MKQNRDVLYIIGNGFDLHHGIPSAYRNFGGYLYEVDYEIYSYVTEYLHAEDDDFWSMFEANLANLDSDALVEMATESLVGYGAEEWSDAYNHDYQYEIERVVTGLSIKLLKHFSQWIKQLPIPNKHECSTSLLDIDIEAQFLCFNYTNTLEHIYDVPKVNIFYIHGKSTDNNLILGHGWEKERLSESQLENEDYYDQDVRVQEGDSIINGYFSNTFKPTEKIISLNQNIFDEYVHIQKISILGHSLGDVDIPYLKEIIHRINIGKVNWDISYYESTSELRSQAIKIGIPIEKIRFIKLTDMVK